MQIQSILNHYQSGQSLRQIARICGCSHERVRQLLLIHDIPLRRPGGIRIREPRRKRTMEERFWRKVRKDGPLVPHMTTPCWMWLGSTKHLGYGVFTIKKGYVVGAHVASWLIHHKLDKMQKGTWVLHNCDNPSCVNPVHLREGTPADNVRDREERSAHKRIQAYINKLHQRGFTQYQIDTIRQQCGIKTYTQLAQEFNCTYAKIYAITHRTGIFKYV